MQYIGDKAFDGCNVEIVGELPKNLKYIGEEALCISNEDFTLPASVEYMGDSAFRGSDIVNLTIEEGVTRLSVHAFANCEYLEHIELPDSLEYLGDYCFSGCYNLTDVKGSFANIECYYKPFYETKFIENYMSDNENEPMVTLGSILLKYKDTSSDSITIPDNIKVIVEGACQFDNCHNVTLPDGLTYLDKGWIKYGLKFKANLPSTVKYLYDGRGFEEMSEISLPNIVVLGSDVFRLNKNIEKIVLADSLTHLGDCVFMAAANLSDITINAKNIQYWGDGCFVGTKWLEDKYKSSNFLILDGILLGVNPDAYADNTDEIVIPDSVVRIADSNVFYRHNASYPIWTYGKTIVIPTTVKEVDYEALTWLPDATVRFADGTVEIPEQFLAGCAIKDVIIPSGVKTIGDYAFSKCEISSGVIEIPDTVEVIGEHAFKDAYSIVELPEGVKEIKTEGVSVSYNTDGSFVLPDSVESLGKHAIGGHVDSISIGENTSLQTIYASSLDDVTSWTYKGKSYKAYGKEDNSYTLLLKELENDGVKVIWDISLEAEYGSVK